MLSFVRKITNALSYHARVFCLGLFIFMISINAFAQTEDLNILNGKLAKATTPGERFAVMYHISVYYKNTGKLDSMLTYVTRLLDIAHELNDDSLLVMTYNDLGNALEFKSDYPVALEFYLKALRLAENKMSAKMIQPMYNNIGLIYMDLGNYKECLNYLKKSLKYLPEAAKESAEFPVIIYENLAETYLALDNIDSALYYIRLSYDLDLKINDNYSRSNILYDLGLVYEKLGKPELAVSYYKQSIAFSDSTGDLFHLADATKYYAQFLLKQSDYANAKKIALQGFNAGKKSDYKAAVIDASEILEKSYTGLHQKDSAYYYGTIKNNYRDSVFNETKVNQLQDMTFKEQVHEADLQQAEEKYKYRTRLYFLLGGLSVVLLLAVILLRNNRQKQKAYTLLKNQKQEIDLQKLNLEKAIAELKSTQAQLIQSEKMASLGELTAGIAHEIQNPLNFVNNFSEVSVEVLNELKEGPLKKLAEPEKKEAEEMLENLTGNLAKITRHGKRADSIVKGMLQHSRINAGVKKPTDLNLLIEEYLRLSFNNQRMTDKSFDATVEKKFDKDIHQVSIVPEDIGRVLLNLFSNAFYSVKEKKKIGGDAYQPVISVSTSRSGDGNEKNGTVEITIKDNGTGIPEKILDKIFQPFFTTKPAGQGTGLGLSLSYDIITKEHNGKLKVETKDNEFTAFTIQIPG
ncbi:MAG: tetratricopeptide repeat protein [Bacteroidetes bacterium]|nr:tetratricopeptide repeat protein [Bacteroidota bacterium]